MKKLFVSIVCVLGLFCCTAQNLPSGADNFVATFFPNNSVTGIAEFDSGAFAFRVELDSDISVYFDAYGKWQLVESFSSDISSLLNQQTKNSIIAMGNNPANAVRIRCNEGEHTTVVTFNDGACHVFSASGDFLRKIEE